MCKVPRIVPFLIVGVVMGVVIALSAAGAGGGSSSEACLPCHSGGGAGPEIRRDVSHPFDVEYASASARHRTLKQPSSPSGFGGTIEQDLLVDGAVTCISCHYDHDTETNTIFRLRLVSTPSNLCRTCHEVD